MIVPEKTTNPKQKRYSVKEKAGHILYMLEREDREEKKGNLTAYAKHYGISRQTLYEEKKKFVLHHEEGKSGRKRGSKKCQKKRWNNLQEKEKTRVVRVVLESAVSPTSLTEIRAIVGEAFELTISKRRIRAIIEEYSVKAQQLLEKIDMEKYVKHMAIDEIFSGNQPILTGVDLHSFAVVICQKADNRDGLTWKKQLNKFPNLELVTSDQAKGIMTAVAMNPAVKHQFDLFHVKWDIGKLLRHLLAQAYKKIEAEYKAQKRWQKSKNEQEKLLVEYQRLQKEAIKSIKVFDEVEKSVKIIYQAMEIFDEHVEFIDPQKSLKKIFAAADRMKKASNNRKIINISKRIIDPKLLLFLTELKRKLLAFPLCWNKGAAPMTRTRVNKILAKHCFFSSLSEPHLHFRDGESRKHLLQRRHVLKNKLSHEHCQNLFEVRILQMSLANFQSVFSSIGQALSSVFRSSSLVESFNSQIRIAQQVKKSLHQNFLALSILKWNMTPFEGGKRKGKSPYQLLGLPLKHKNWLDLLLAT